MNRTTVHQQEHICNQSNDNHQTPTSQTVGRKVLAVFGTRPEAIKMAPVVLSLRESPQLHVKVCVTAQHREMLDQVLTIFGISPEYDLDIMSSGQDLYDITQRVITGMRDVLSDSKPDIVLVHGDTTTTMAAALASFYQQIQVGHVEAGLRTGNPYNPWPEEMNRQLTGRIASLHFAPTPKCRTNLLNEAVSDDQIFITGNTVIDALFRVVKMFNDTPRIKEEQRSLFLSQLEFDPEKTRYVLMTMHRRESFGDGIVSICKAVKTLAALHPKLHFVFPVHLNPNVSGPVHDLLGNQPNIHLIKPLDYLSFVYLMHNCYLILTDSGGIQEEAPSLGKPVLVLRETTERPEAVEAGTVMLVGSDTDQIILQSQQLLTDEEAYHRMSVAHNPYGDGLAADRIRHALLSKQTHND